MSSIDRIIAEKDRKESQEIILQISLQKVRDPNAPTQLILTKGQEYHIVDHHFKGNNFQKKKRTSTWHESIVTMDQLYQMLMCNAKFGKPVHSNRADNLYYISVHYPHPIGQENGRMLYQATIHVRPDALINSFHPSTCGKCAFGWMHKFQTCLPKECFKDHFPDTEEKAMCEKWKTCLNCSLPLIYFKK